MQPPQVQWPTAPAAVPSPAAQRPQVPAVVGLLLLVPAAIGWLLSYVLPTVWTVRTSFLSASLLANRPTRSVGLANYRDPARTLTAYNLALSMGAAALLVAVVVAPVLAFAAYRAGRVGRWVVRVAFVLPMVLVAPTLLALSWQISLAGTGWLANPLSAIGTLHLVGWLTTAGVAGGVAVTAFLAVFHRPANRGAPWLAALVVAGLLVIGVVAIALQTYALPLVLTRGGPVRSTQTPMYQIYDFAIARLQLGPASANATILLAVLAVLGLGAWLLMLLTRLRVEIPARATNPDRAPSAGWGVAGVVVLVAVLGVVAYGLWPWLSHSVFGGGQRVPRGATAPRLFVDTWLPPLLSTVVGVGVAAIGGFGIGALRPFGRYSELLLLPFAPWLFVGLGPLALANFASVRDDGQLDTFVGLIPRVWVVVPALFLFTILFRGLAEQAGGRWSATLLPALPMLFLVGGATWLLYAQDITWTLLTSIGSGTASGPVYGLNFASEYAAAMPAPNTAYPLALVLLFAAVLAVAQVFYLDRLTIHIGRR